MTLDLAMASQPLTNDNETIRKNNKLDFIKIKNFCALKVKRENI